MHNIQALCVCVLYLFLWWGTELSGLASRLCCRHGEGQHKFVITLPLIGLNLSDELIREGNDGLNAVTQFTVTEILQQSTHLTKKGRNSNCS